MAAGMELIFATKNNGKMKEIRQIMADSGYRILSMEEAGLDIDVHEDGETFEENAVYKSLIFTCVFMWHA